MAAMPAVSLSKFRTGPGASERARSSLCCATSMPTYTGSEADGVVVVVRVMRVSLSCECERGGGLVRRTGGSVDCSGEWTRGRLGPRSVTAVMGRGTIGRGPVAVSA